jgi:hypothetical protein
MPLPHFQKNAFQPAERSAADLHAIADPHERVRRHGQPGFHDRLDAGDLCVIYWNGHPARSNNLQDAWRFQYREPYHRIKSGKDVSGEQGQFDLAYAIRPKPPAFFKRQEALVSFALEQRRDTLLVSRSDLYREP